MLLSVGLIVELRFEVLVSVQNVRFRCCEKLHLGTLKKIATATFKAV